MVPQMFHVPNYYDEDFLAKAPPYYDPRDPTSIARYLDRIAKTNDLLAKRLAPKRLMSMVRFSNVAAGTTGSGVTGSSGAAPNGLIIGPDGSQNTNGSIQMREDWNGLVVSVSQGQIDWAFGSVGQQGANQLILIPYDMFSGVTVVPIYIPLPPQGDSNNKIQFWADNGATTVTTGTVWFVNY